jgi:hypothetical protein
MPTFLTREQAAQLLAKNVHTFASERQRGEMPLVWRGDSPAILSEAGSGVTECAETEARRGYTTEQVFLALLRDEFVRELRLDRKRAAEIAGNALGIVVAQWPAIYEGSLAIAEGREPETEIVFGAFNLVSGAVVCRGGPLSEIVAGLPAPVAISILINVTRAAGELRARAAKLKIELGEVWSGRREPPPSRLKEIVGRLHGH